MESSHRVLLLVFCHSRAIAVGCLWSAPVRGSIKAFRPVDWTTQTLRASALQNRVQQAREIASTPRSFQRTPHTSRGGALGVSPGRKAVVPPPLGPVEPADVSFAVFI